MTANPPDNDSHTRPPDASDACCINALDKQFDEGYFRSALRSYKESGLGKRAQLLVDFLQTQGLEGRSLLEIGCGIGALHAELLSRGAASAVGIDASPAAIQAADALMEEMGLADRVEHRRGDFVDLQDQIEEADVVLLDRVVCCYPNMDALMNGAARHARGIVGITMPRRAWWMKAGVTVINLVERLLRRPFRVYYHDHDKLDAVVTGQGFTRVYRASAGVWETMATQTT